MAGSDGSEEITLGLHAIGQFFGEDETDPSSWAVPSIPERREAGLALSTLNQAFDSIEVFIVHIKQATDETLLDWLRVSAELENKAFRVRGAIVREIRERLAVRLSGGRGKIDKDGVGITVQLQKVAKEIGVSLTSLKRDAQLSELFEGDKAADLIPRPYLVAALSSPDPVAMAHMAADKITAGETYTTAQFTQDIKAITGGAPTDRIAAQRWLSFRASQELANEITALRQRWSMDLAQVVSRLITESKPGSRVIDLPPEPLPITEVTPVTVGPDIAELVRITAPGVPAASYEDRVRLAVSTATQGEIRALAGIVESLQDGVPCSDGRAVAVAVNVLLPLLSGGSL